MKTYEELHMQKMILVAKTIQLMSDQRAQNVCCDMMCHLKDDMGYEDLRIPHGADNSPKCIAEAIDLMGERELGFLENDLIEAANQ